MTNPPKEVQQREDGAVAWRYRFHTDASLAGRPNVRQWALSTEEVKPHSDWEAEPLYTHSSSASDKALMEEAATALEALVAYDSYETEYDGQTLTICPDCHKQDGDHDERCEFVKAKALLAALRARIKEMT